MISSIFVFILFLNAALASPAPSPFQVTESPTGEMHDSIGVGDREATLGQPKAKAAGNLTGRQTDQTVTIPMTCDKNGCRIQVGIGTPPATTYTVRVDGTSGETWVGVNKFYQLGSSSMVTNQSIKIDYGAAEFQGRAIIDTLSLGPNLLVRNQTVGDVFTDIAASMSPITKGADGLFGLGRISSATIIDDSVPSRVSTTGTVLDNLYQQGVLNLPIFSFFTQPLGTSESVPGSLIFGGTGDTSNLTSGITFFPSSLVTNDGVNNSWALDMNIEYDTTNIMSTMPVAFVPGNDGFTLNLASFEAYRRATGAVATEDGRLSLPPDQLQNLKPLDFMLFGMKYSLSPNAQAASPVAGQAPGTQFLVAAAPSSSNPLNAGFGASVGNGFMSRFFTTYNSEEGTIGIATTIFTEVEVD